MFIIGYSDVISRTIIQENCDLLADGTILPDIEESFGVKITDLKESISLEEEKTLMEKNKRGFVKSQHNLDIEYEVEATVQPVASLTKPEVREILEYLNLPTEHVYRKAFPGPALSARIIGPVSLENLAYEKKIHDIVESTIEDYYLEHHGKTMIINDKGEQEPFQAFAVTTTDILLRKVTGIIDGQRTYEVALSIKGEWDFEKLTRFASQIKGYSRALYELHESHQGVYDIVIRSINSIDAHRFLRRV